MHWEGVASSPPVVKRIRGNDALGGRGMNALFPKQIELTILDLDENLSCYMIDCASERRAKLA